MRCHWCGEFVWLTYCGTCGRAFCRTCYRKHDHRCRGPVEVEEAMSENYEVICDQSDRNLWLQYRREGIGSSDASAIMGVNRWSSPLSVYADKLGLAEEDTQGEAAWWGHALEPLVAQRYSMKTTRKVFMAGELLRSKERPWMQCTLDATTEAEEGGTGILEIKCTRLYYRWEEGPPPDVYCQVQHQMAVTGMQWAAIAVLFQGSEFYFCEVERNDTFIAQMVKEESAFWDRILNQEPPSADASDATKEALKRLYPDDNGQSIVLGDGAYLSLDEQRAGLDEQIKILQSEKQGIDNRLKAAIGDATEAQLINGTVYTYKSDKRGVRSLRRKESRQ